MLGTQKAIELLNNITNNKDVPQNYLCFHHTQLFDYSTVLFSCSKKKTQHNLFSYFYIKTPCPQAKKKKINALLKLNYIISTLKVPCVKVGKLQWKWTNRIGLSFAIFYLCFRTVLTFSMEIFICSFHEEALIVTILTFLIIVTYFNIFFL